MKECERDAAHAEDLRATRVQGDAHAGPNWIQTLARRALPTMRIPSKAAPIQGTNPSITASRVLYAPS